MRGVCMSYDVCTCPMHQRGSPELDEIVLAARLEQAHRWVPFNTHDVPSTPVRPYAHGGIVGA
jgi:hypothetical protein